MIKNIVSGMVLAACCALAQATPTEHWTFTWKGFDTHGSFDPWATFNGTFGGFDANRDSVLSLDELSYLNIDGQKLLTCSKTPNDRCNVESFSYSEAGGLQFTADRYSYRYSSPYGWVSSADEYVAHERIESWRFGLFGDWHDTYTWSPQTQETITRIAAVPEPATYAMLGAGLILLAGASRRRDPR